MSDDAEKITKMEKELHDTKNTAQKVLFRSEKTERSIDSILEAVGELTKTVGKLTTNHEEMKKELTENTKVTTDVRDLVRAGKMGAAFIKYVGMVVAPVAAIAAAWHQFFHGGGK